MSSTSAETFGVKLNYAGQMRRFPLAAGTSFKDLREKVHALLAIPKDVDIVLKYADEESDLITISSDLELNSALVPGSLLRLTVIETGVVTYPVRDAPMLDAAPTAPPATGEDAFRSFGGHPHPPHPHPPGFGVVPHGFDAPPHGGGGPAGPYRGGLGFRGGRGGFPHHHGHHGGRGGFGHHGRGGFHGYGPYGHSVNRSEMSPEEWQNFKKERKEMHKEMKRGHKEMHKYMKRECKEGRGGGFRCADGMQWGWGNPGTQVINLTNDDRLVARFAKDITIPDGTLIEPNTPFIKTWRLRNEGAAWPAGCVLRFLGKKSDKMGSAETIPLPIEGAVAPNAEVDVSVNLVAPAKPGRYTGYWKMTTPEGRKFGQRVWASIVVPGSSSSSGSSSSDSDREADRYEAMVDAVLATGLNAKRHRIFRMLQKTNGDVNLVCEKLSKKEEKKARKAMKKQMKI